MKTIRDINVKDKVILVRVDYNIPIEKGTVTSDLRIRASFPTLDYLLEHGAKKIILISHLGRPEGKIVPAMSLKPIIKVLEKHYKDQTIGFYPLPKTGEKLNIPDNVKIALLENLRFDPREETNDSDFIKNIVDSVDADLYVQDGFAVVHRAHASTDAIKHVLPIYAGFLLEKEITNLESTIKNPEKPVLLIIGGAKVTDKQPLIDKFTNLADHIFVGGKIAADGYKPNNDRIIVATDFDENAKGDKLDIGPLSTGQLAELIKQSNTIIWNGLLGYAEDPAYATSSTITAELIGEKPASTTTIICGGDTTGFVEHLEKTHKDLHYSLVSTGGGASLEFLLGNPLPGLLTIS